MATYLVYVPKSAPGRSPAGVNSYLVSAVDEASALAAARVAGDDLPSPTGSHITVDGGWLARRISLGDLETDDIALEGDPVGRSDWSRQRGN